MHISSRTHGILDYIVGLILILSPAILGLDSGSVEARIPMIVGWATLAYSLLTRYELGLFKLIPFGAHLMLDVLGGLLLLVSPWLFQFADRVWVPHVIFGVIELGAVAMTRRVTRPHSGIPGAPTMP